jgi:hypothetical protein
MKKGMDNYIGKTNSTLNGGASYFWLYIAKRYA